MIDWSKHSPKETPPNQRPYQTESASWVERQTRTAERRQVWRQVGWHGQTGAFYSLDEDPSRFEPGSFSALWLLVDEDEHVHHVWPDLATAADLA